MALGEVTLRDWWRVMRREFFAGLTLGIILGTIGFLRIAAVVDGFSPLRAALAADRPDHRLLAHRRGDVGNAFRLDAAVCVAAAGLDPATSSAPFVATLVDVTGLIIYFTVALLILRGTLL